MTSRELQRARRLLCQLQDHIRDTIIAARVRQSRDFARVAAVTAADTIYHVDRLGEHAIVKWFEAHWPRAWPVQVVMEGLEDGDDLTFPHGTPVARTVFKCILDPIDGTRNLMYDKRSAWILGALAPQRGPRTHLGNIIIAAMTELPTSRQWRADQLSAVKGQGVVAEAVNVLEGTRRRFKPAPSRERDCLGGFASITRFFPEGKTLTSEIEEKLWATLYGLGRQASPLVFEDQYISTGGQLYEIISGHDRFIADLRPLVFAKIGLPQLLVCHPYDICTALIAREAGCVVEAPLGGPLRAPLDTTSPVGWAAYANPALALHIRPVLRRLIKEMLGA
jgi:fructose-1,6-bisphosphatase/inositol monophosphatase family enzyme